MTMKEAIQSDFESDKRIVGSWYVEVSSPAQGAFPALLTFTGDGTVLAAESPAPYESSGHGSWIRREQGGIAYTFVALFGNEKGENTARLKVNGTLQHVGRTAGWKGPFSIRAVDPAGGVVMSDSGLTTLTPILVEPLV